MSGLASPLLQQFIPEARELLEQAGRALLALERDPRAAAPMQELFRAMHTLKGTSGLFEIAPFTRLVHAAEDLLGAAQAGRLALTPALADLLLDTLDQLGLWVDALASGGALPAEAAEAAARREAGLRAPLGPQAAAAAEMAQAATPPDWLAALTPAERAALPRGVPLVALRYVPDEHCFFRGEDPLGLARQIPSLRLLRLFPLSAWPALDMLDPFRSMLGYLAVAEAPVAAVEELFRYVRDQAEIVALAPGWDEAARHAAATGTAETLRALLAAQRRLLEAGGAEDAIADGRVAAARTALARIAAQAGWADVALPLDVAGLLAAIGGLEARLDTPAAEAAAAAAVDAVLPDAPRAAPTTLRVEQAKIDTLMNLIGELIVAKNALAWLARRAEQESLPPRELAREIKDRQALVSRIAEAMQGAVLAVRMLPVEQVFQRFPRLVRDVARRLDKQVELVLEGGETEADKTIVEALADPLVHMVRNSLDHGIETPAERIAAGKPELGRLLLSAAAESDHVVIRVEDDGRGLDPARLRARAAEKGLVEPARAAALSDEEACQLIFLPGFSTAAEVSDLSGRGVGMDVVRSTIERVGGRLTLASRKGEGTRFEIILPLSMAVTRLMTIACGESLFGVPMSLVAETVRVPRERLRRLGEREAFVLRDRLVPVLRLARLLDLPETGEAPPAEEAILVVQVNGQRLGLVIGAFRDVMEAIVRPLDGVLAGLLGFGGTTLLGDGRVLLVLDLPELMR
jgi:two-component system chemotaxis sensor kinase CheA